MAVTGADKPKKKRRSKEAMRKLRARQEIKRAAREARRKEIREEHSRSAEAYCLRCYERERKRADQRAIQDAGIEWIYGHDTPGARAFAAEVARLQKRQRDKTEQLETEAKAEAKERRTRKLSAPAKTEKAVVSSPLNPGLIDRLDRVVDTVFLMRRRNQIGEHEYQAAEQLRQAYEILDGQIGNAMDPDKVMGSGGGSKSPTPQSLWAAETIRRAQKKMTTEQVKVVELVLRYNPNTGHGGMTIESAAQTMFGKRRGKDPATKHFVDKAGQIFRAGLSKFAMSRLGPLKEPKIQRWRDPENKPDVSTRSGTRHFESTVVHATSDKIYKTRR